MSKGQVRRSSSPASLPRLPHGPGREEKQMSKDTSNIIKSLHGVWANDNHFKNIRDLATAALVCEVLGDLDEASRRELLERIVSLEMRTFNGGTVEAQQVFRNTWIGVNKGLIADLINEGKSIDTSSWTEASHNKAYKKTVKFLK